ncbi:MAG: nucleotide sugar dehydrogenase [Prevotella sp.]|jgi:UDP-N-acetyl-D-mannosaminuronic acid dehydrogenase|nr:nucleotide sugar dehydrogenase [Prevotella sp.]
MYDVCIIGGCGHVGLPLAIALADKGKKVCVQDIDEVAAEAVKRGELPFSEEGAEPLLKKVLEEGLLQVSLDAGCIADSKIIICIVGTPVDEHLNPKFGLMKNIIGQYVDYFRDGQLLILRSTVFPGITSKVRDWLFQKGKKMHVAFCPERILEGKAMTELKSLPQIISSFSEEGLSMSKELFSCLNNDIVVVEPMEAELAKLFTNVWRYIKFAAANQFYMIANNYGLDFYNIYRAMTHNYERAQDLPRPGLAAGPCLFKDSMQLGAFNDGDFYLGHSAMLINEGLPNYMVKRLKQKYDLSSKTVGILGMAFKSGSDDIRESLSYKLKKILELEASQVLCTDPYVKDDRLLTLEEVIGRSDIIVIATPHLEYSNIDVKGKVVADVWNVTGNGGVI